VRVLCCAINKDTVFGSIILLCIIPYPAGGGFFKNKNKNSFRKGEVSKQVVYDGHGRVRTIIIVLVAGERCSIPGSQGLGICAVMGAHILVHAFFLSFFLSFFLAPYIS